MIRPESWLNTAVDTRSSHKARMTRLFKTGLTGQQAVTTAVRHLNEAGVADAPRDARKLLAHALGVSSAALGVHIFDPLTQKTLKAFEEAIQRRLRRQPVSQIIGTRHFATRTFQVTPDVLDPRPETEILIEVAKTEPYTRVLDLGLGSGVILCTLLADRRGQCTGVGVDVTEAACAVAFANAQSTGVIEVIDIFISDWFEHVEGQFDLIVTNPPYIAASEMSALAPEVREWEPHGALSDGGDGLTAYRRISAQVLTYLAPGGRFICEIGPTQAKDVVHLLEAAGLVDIHIHQDFDARDRVVSARHPVLRSSIT
jgi:release factor glutamine methyltransferase